MTEEEKEEFIRLMNDEEQDFADQRNVQRREGRVYPPHER